MGRWVLGSFDWRKLAERNFNVVKMPPYEPGIRTKISVAGQTLLSQTDSATLKRNSQRLAIYAEIFVFLP